MLDSNAAVRATTLTFLQIDKHTVTKDRQVFDTHLAPAVNRGVNRSTPRADWKPFIIRERNNKMVVVIPAIEGADHDNVWEIEQLCDSLEMHRV